MGEMAQSVAFLDHFSGLNDPRQSGKVVYPLKEIMLLVLCGELAGAEGFADIADWGEMHVDFLRRFLPFARGIPCHDVLNDLFNALDHETFRESFVTWAESLRTVAPDLSGPEVVAIDGKTSRRSGDATKGRAALHLVSAWATAQRLVLGQQAIQHKENEIVAIPRLLEMLELKGALVTIDAMGCQKAIAQTIHDKGADYLLPVKDNQPALRQDLELFFTEQQACSFADAEAFFHQTVEKDHGRIETRRHWSIADVDWLTERHDWAALSSIGLIEREIEHGGKSETTRHFYIASLPADAVLLARAARSHWGVENSLHWCLDVVFHDDLCRLRTGHGPQNFAIVRHIALNLLTKAKGKISLRRTRKKAGWSTDFLEQVIRTTPDHSL
jgi:predicted transposase YbfD/YdcC